MGTLTNVIAAAAHSSSSRWSPNTKYVGPFARECSEFIDQPVPTAWASYVQDDKGLLTGLGRLLPSSDTVFPSVLLTPTLPSHI
jgi:hypothetical protein